ncbi:uncharacterized protein [Panulirus ornatus]|uniref:uncharacterized protein n=1 Tax=Panulirus ornatus TaxID=150431 RepID=UPI003A83BF7A
MERGRHSWRLRATAVQLLVLALWAWPATCAPRPDSPEADTPTRANALEMLLLTPRTSSLPSIGGSGPGSSADLVNYYIPVIMAEMAAPVSTRDPSVIRVTGCRQGFMEDQSGGCRPIFNPTPYYPRSTRPNRSGNQPSRRPHRHTSVASILPMIRSPPRVPRPEIQTQRDLIRQFSRRRPAWFRRSLADSKDAAPADAASADAAPAADAPAPDAGTDGPSPRTRRKLVPVPVSATTTPATDATTTTISSATPTSTTTDTTTIAPSTTTVDCDD